MLSQPLLFVCHSSTDLALVRELLRQCDGDQRLRFWLSEDDIAIGQSYAQSIFDAIASCEALVVLLSEAALKSEQVRREVGLAVGHNRRVLPILLSGDLMSHPAMTGDWKYWLHTTQAVVWVDSAQVAEQLRNQLGVAGQPQRSSVTRVVVAEDASISLSQSSPSRTSAPDIPRAHPSTTSSDGPRRLLEKPLSGHKMRVDALALGGTKWRKLSIASLGLGESLRIWNSQGERTWITTRPEVPPSSQIAAMTLVGGREPLIATASGSGLINLSGSADLQARVEHSGKLDKLAIGKWDSGYVVAGCNHQGRVTVWRLDRPRIGLAPVLSTATAGLSALTVGRLDGEDVVVWVTRSGFVQVHGASGPRRIVAQTRSVSGVALSRYRNGEVIVCAERNGALSLWSGTGVLVAEIQIGRTEILSALAGGSAPGLEALAVGFRGHDGDGLIEVWELP